MKRIRFTFYNAALVLYMVTGSTPVHASSLDEACELAMRRLSDFRDAKVERSNESFVYNGQTYKGCVVTIDGDRTKIPPDREMVSGFYPSEGSPESKAGWKVVREADGPDGTFFHVTRDNVFCIVNGRWDGGDDSDPTYVPSPEFQIVAQCAFLK